MCFGKSKKVVNYHARRFLRGALYKSLWVEAVVLFMTSIEEMRIILFDSTGHEPECELEDCGFSAQVSHIHRPCPARTTTNE